ARPIRLCRAAGARALLRMRTDERETVRCSPSSRCQTAHLVPTAHSCARGLRLCFTHPEPRGGRSADPPPEATHVASGCPRLLQRLSFLLLRPPHAASTILRVHRFEPG